MTRPPYDATPRVLDRRTAPPTGVSERSDACKIAARGWSSCRPCELAESGRDLLLHRATQGSLDRTISPTWMKSPSVCWIFNLLGIGSAAVRMEIHSPGPRQTAHDIGESDLETAAQQ